jgi:hypothetical protein
MKIVDIKIYNLWNLHRIHYEFLSWDGHIYWNQDEQTSQFVNKFYSFEFILSNFKVLITLLIK